ncbi:MAG: oligosaccharide flippase family protein, partial [Ruthenibacterium sp.]
MQKSYVKNAAILTVTGLILRMAGMFFRVYIAGKIGAEGMGVYQLIFTVYTLAITLATAGLSIVATR